MNRENKWLLAIAGVLALSALVTGGIVLSLALDQDDGERVPASGAESIEPPVAVAAEDPTGEPRLVYVSDREGDPAVYVGSADGTDRRRISPDGLGVCTYPSWSPDGERVAYWGSEGGSIKGTQGARDIWVSAADGSEHTRIGVEGASADHIPPPAWSPNGTELAFVGVSESPSGTEQGYTLYVARADGSGVERSLELAWRVQHLVWSPGGDRLLLVNVTGNSGTLYMWPTGGGELVPVFQGVEVADWSPDGRSFVVGDTNNGRVTIVDSDGQAEPVIDVHGYPLSLDWSPDGSRIAIGTSRQIRRGRSLTLYFSSSLYVLTLETGDVAPLTENEGRIHYLKWSPDGTRLVYTLVDFGARAGSPVPWANLYSYDVTSGKLEQITQEEGFAGFGSWSP